MITFLELGKYGRMGNAMFQMAAAIGLATKHNDSYIFPKWEYENFFNINSFDDNVRARVRSKYEESHYVYKEIPYKENLNIHGYFQSYKYFNHCEGVIKKELSPNLTFPKFERVCSVHVRRGDYLKFPRHHPLCSIDYYKKAMQQMDVEKFMIFSDDIPWCKQHFHGNVEFVEGNPCYTDLALMMSCDHHIIANSSFSWWGAWLAGSKKVIAPARWFGVALERTHPTHDLIPSKWVRL